jgi:hypothetical protein
MFLAFAGFLLTFVIAVAHVHLLFKFILAIVLMWGPIFAVLAWATRRALRNPFLKNQAPKERKATWCCNPIRPPVPGILVLRGFNVRYHAVVRGNEQRLITHA